MVVDAEKDSLEDSIRLLHVELSGDRNEDDDVGVRADSTHCLRKC